MSKLKTTNGWYLNNYSVTKLYNYPTTKASFFPNFDKYRIYSSGINTGVLVVLRQVISSPMSNPVSLYHINYLLL